MVYLLHFSQPYKHARHYLGYADDLPDFCYRDAYDDNATPAQAARAAIQNARDEM